MSTEYVFSNFGGVLYDNTTYIMVESISRSAEFTLAPDNNGTGIIWDGAGFTITATPPLLPWLGVFPCTANVWNLGIVSGDTAAANAGWFFQSGIGGSATNCYSTGTIGDNGGGIFGGGSSGIATNCYSSGIVGIGGGGIFGSGSGGTATNCFSSGNYIGDYGGGIFGSVCSGIATNCYSIGTLGLNGAGGIFGAGSTGQSINSDNTPLGWADTAARIYLTGTPSTSPGTGPIWVSSGLNNPFTLNPTTACFFGDAPVLTPSGYRRIDSLRVGDIVTTLTGEDIITRIYMRSTPAGPNDNPYRIPAGTFGAVKPLLISPRHCIAVKGAMVEARKSGLKQAAKEGVLTYYNLELKRHSTMIVAGVEVESYVSR